MIQERSKLTNMEIVLQNLLPVGSIVEEDVPSSESLPESLEGCISCGELTHEMNQCQEMDELFPFLPVGWQVEWIGDDFIWRPGPTGASSQGEGLVARIISDYEPQLPVVGEDIPGQAITNYLGAVRSLRTVDQRTMVVGRGVRLPCSDSDESEDDLLSIGPMRPVVTAAPLGGTRGQDGGMIQANSLHNKW